MKTERVYQENTARIIQQKQDGSGVLQCVDNRPVNQLLQRVGEDEEEKLVEKNKENDQEIAFVGNAGLCLLSPLEFQKSHKSGDKKALPDNCLLS